MNTRRAAQSTVDALLYALRGGLTALDNNHNMTRLAELGDDQLQDVAATLLKRSIARPWAPHEIEALAIIWSELNGRR